MIKSEEMAQIIAATVKNKIQISKVKSNQFSCKTLIPSWQDNTSNWNFNWWFAMMLIRLV